MDIVKPVQMAQWFLKGIFARVAAQSLGGTMTIGGVLLVAQPSLESMAHQQEPVYPKPEDLAASAIGLTAGYLFADMLTTARRR